MEVEIQKQMHGHLFNMVRTKLNSGYVLHLKVLKQLVTGKVGVKQLSGPVGIVNMVDTTYNESKSYGVFIVIAQFLNIGILLSANLGS